MPAGNAQEIADKVADAIVAASLPVTFIRHDTTHDLPDQNTVTRDSNPRYDPKQVEKIRVSVLPGTYEESVLTRVNRREIFGTDVVLMKLCVTKTQEDEATDVVNGLRQMFSPGEQLAGYTGGDAFWMGVEQRAAPMQQQDEFGVFATMLRHRFVQFR